ncbi:MAG TPA: tRNA (guanosine(37)-N1)-methyltransferase TrmD [Acidiferrobacteraceae bacterium]|nr:tRNA (guanosine(37)-N1)-methyltransferase TrmD [Acidiferrobacteraceae bacterium]
MRIDVVTIFPQMFDAIIDYGVTRRALEQGQMSLQCWNPRDYTTDKYRRVDDRPFGGGPGMVMMADPLDQALRRVREAQANRAKVLYLSPQGRPLDHPAVVELAARQGLILLAGRYEGVDERLLQAQVDEEWSIGDYVLSGGELAAMVLIDAVARHIPGTLGNAASAQEDSFATGLLDCGHYTRPAQFAGRTVPEVLLSGDHEQIRRWRLKQSLGRTWLRRPELLDGLQLDAEQARLLEEFQQAHRENQENRHE